MLTADLPRVTEWVCNRCEADPRSVQAAIGWLRDDDLTAGVTYENFTGQSVTATIAVAPGAVFPKDFLWVIFDYPFNQLGCGKMLAYIASDNWKSAKLVERLGFVKEATIADYYPDADMNIYSMMKQQCRFLEKEHGKKDEDAICA